MSNNMCSLKGSCYIYIHRYIKVCLLEYKYTMYLNISWEGIGRTASVLSENTDGSRGPLGPPQSLGPSSHSRGRRTSRARLLRPGTSHTVCCNRSRPCCSWADKRCRARLLLSAAPELISPAPCTVPAGRASSPFWRRRPREPLHSGNY